jgi:hypothetical protein
MLKGDQKLLFFRKLITFEPEIYAIKNNILNNRLLYNEIIVNNL